MNVKLYLRFFAELQRLDKGTNDSREYRRWTKVRMTQENADAGQKVRMTQENKEAGQRYE